MSGAGTIPCRFCVTTDAHLLDTEHFFVIADLFPVNPGHVLIVSRRHAADMRDLSIDEFVDLHGAIRMAVRLCDVEAETDDEKTPDGYNIGANCGGAAGQTVFHFHLHIIPRFTGDVVSPRGGVRNLKPPLTPLPEAK